MRTGLVYIPNLAVGIKSHQTRGKMKGKGAGSVLLDGGLGGQSSYSSIDEYISTTGRNPNAMGSGMGKPLAFRRDEMNSKIKSMMVKPKVKNIKFNL